MVVDFAGASAVEDVAVRDQVLLHWDSLQKEVVVVEAFHHLVLVPVVEEVVAVDQVVVVAAS